MAPNIALISSLVQPVTSGIVRTGNPAATAVNATLLTLCVLLGWATFDLLQELRRRRMSAGQRLVLGAFIALVTVAALAVAALKLL
jgi:hypothetical protein